MQKGLIKDINSYISFLNGKGLAVSVHGKIINGLIEHNLHKNPYCSFIKTDDDAWARCVKCQQKVFNACNNDFLFGMCWAGVEEYVFYVDSKTFVSVSGYGIDINALCMSGVFSDIADMPHFDPGRPDQRSIIFENHIYIKARVGSIFRVKLAHDPVFILTDRVGISIHLF